MNKLEKNDKIAFWINHNLRNYALKGNYLDREAIDHALDWFSSDDAKRHLRQIQKISVPDAIRLAHDWTIRLNKKSLDQDDSAGTKVIKEFSDGYKIVQLQSEQSFKREGLLMNHCVASYFHHRQESTIFSLRDKQNNPQCTIELDENQSFSQIKGNGNSQPHNDCIKYIVEFIQEYSTRPTNTRDLNRLGFVFDIHGKLHDIKKLKDTIKCSGFIDLSEQNLTSIPKISFEDDPDCIFINTLCLSYNNIEEIPDNYNQTAKLILNHNKINKLPKNYQQNSFELHLQSNEIKEIQDDFVVNGRIYISGNRLQKIPEHIKQYSDVTYIVQLSKEIK